MTAGAADGPTDGEIYWDGYVAKMGIRNFPYTDLDKESADGMEAGAAAVAATAIARLGQPGELAEAMTENVRLRKLPEQLYDALTVGGQDAGYVRRHAIGILQAAGIGWQPESAREALDAQTLHDSPGSDL